MTLAPEGRTELGLSGGGCACCATGVGIEPADAAAPVTAHASEFRVDGMTCGNCVRHVTEELSALYGVESVDVALVAGGVSTVTVRSSVPLDDATVAAAVDEAGYRVVAR